MGYPPIEELLPKSGYSVYKLVRLASNRATELADGRKKLVELPSETKTTTVALEEIRSGMVVAKEVADQFTPPKEDAQKPKESKSEAQALGKQEEVGAPE